MNKSKSFFLALICLCLAPALVLAQGDCPTIVQSALAATDAACSATGRNQACYGNVNLTALPMSGAPEFTFSKPGDLVDVGSVQGLDLSPLDAQSQTWGVALMKLQANLPDTLPGQNVSFLLFGNVQIESAVAPASTATQTTETQASGATLTATVNGLAPMIESLTNPTPKMLNAGDILTVDGQDTTTQMFHAQTADGKSGWVPMSSVTLTGDASTLPAVSMMQGAMAALAPTAAPAAVAPAQSPMQAFYFTTGANDAPCAEAPSSGILIQTPEGAGKITLTMNGVDVTLGSTAYVQAASDADNKDELTVNVVEGDGLVKSQGVTRNVPAGTRVQVPLKDDGQNHLVADGTPGNVEPYDNTALAALPVSHLERKVTVAPSLTADQIAALSSAVISVTGGTWNITYGAMTAGAGCPAEAALGLSFANGFSRSDIVHIPDGPFDPTTVVDSSGANLPGNSKVTSTGPNTFTIDFSDSGSTVNYAMTVISPTHIDLLTTIDTEDGCTITMPGSMDLAS